jgi:hypothetical protein
MFVDGASGARLFEQVGLGESRSASDHQNEIVGRMRSIAAASFFSTAAWYCVSSAATAFLSASADPFMPLRPMVIAMIAANSTSFFISVSSTVK